MKKIFLAALSAIVFLISSCSNEEVFDYSSNSENISNLQHSAFDVSKGRAELARTVALSLQESGTREIISELVLKQRDGDYEVLLDEAISGNNYSNELRSTSRTTLKDIFASAYDSRVQLRSQGTEMNSFEEFTKTLLKVDPLVQISVVGIEDEQKVDLTAENLLVVYLPKDFDDQKEIELIGYDKFGKEYKFKSTDEPKSPTIVIGGNERLLALDKNAPAEVRKKLGTLFYAGTFKDYYLLPNLVVDAGEIASLRSDNVSLRSYAGQSDRERNPSKSEYLTAARFTSQSALREFESGWGGRPEMRYTIIPIKTPGTKIDQHCGDKGWWNGAKNRLNVRLFNWNQDVFGDYYLVHWIEVDGGALRTIQPSVEVPTKWFKIGVSLSIDLGASDDVVGGAFVGYTDPALSEARYDIGNLFSFFIQIR